jgi:aquaporin Z
MPLTPWRFSRHRSGVQARFHWPEYLAEAGALGLFMISASLFTTLLEHYESPLRHIVPDPFVRRMLMGAAMGLTAAAIIYSPLGARSGAHMNPAVTLAFVRLGKVARADAAIYIAAQFAGGIVGMVAAHGILGELLAEPAVEFIATRPGNAGEVAAVAGELIISFVMMSVLLRMAAHPRTMRWTGIMAGVLVMLNITFEAPLSGMSMNPARSFGPALLAGRFDNLWIYFIVPPLGMIAAAELFRRRRVRTDPCAKLNHSSHVRCIFCGYMPGRAAHPDEPQTRRNAKDICITT